MPTWSILLVLGLLAGALVVLGSVGVAGWLLVRRKRAVRGFEILPPK